jgi:hypothetical protein
VNERGQTTVEYLMIGGFVTAIAVIVLQRTFGPWNCIVQSLVDRLLNDPVFPVFPRC